MRGRKGEKRNGRFGGTNHLTQKPTPGRGQVTHALQALIPGQRVADRGRCLRRWLKGPHTDRTFRQKYPRGAPHCTGHPRKAESLAPSSGGRPPAVISIFQKAPAPLPPRLREVRAAAAGRPAAHLRPGARGLPLLRSRLTENT